MRYPLGIHYHSLEPAILKMPYICKCAHTCIGMYPWHYLLTRTTSELCVDIASNGFLISLAGVPVCKLGTLQAIIDTLRVRKEYWPMRDGIAVIAFDIFLIISSK